jgi:Sulfate permease family
LTLFALFANSLAHFAVRAFHRNARKEGPQSSQQTGTNCQMHHNSPAAMFLGVVAFAILFLLREAAPHNRKMARVLVEDRWLPKSVLCLRDYGANKFLHDLIAGITVGLVALPLAMAFAIASGLTPQAGIYCAIVTGFLISALGGSKTQIGGPTGAFVVVSQGLSRFTASMDSSCAP